MVKLSQDAAPRGYPAGTVIDGRYKVVRFIGQGGAGLVHEVEHARTGRRLAMKTLLDEAGYARLEQEAKATSLMKNPHAVKITDMGTGTGVAAGPYLVMELLEGQSLRALLEEAGQLPVELTVNIALQVCECLAEAHGHGIIHRDLKPENLILAASPWPGQYDVKVLDFGVVKISVDGPIPHSSLTRTGSTVGTPYYMSLEQLRNSSAVDARADIYALGVVLYEALSGRKPFEADTIGDLVYALCSGPPTNLARLRPDAPAEVCQVVMRALSMNRDDRQASMEEVATALLPFGNSAFGLWMRAEARRQEAAARPRPEATRTGARPALVGPAAGRPAVPRPVSAAAPPDPSAAVAARATAAEPAAAGPGEAASPPDQAIAAPRPGGAEAGHDPAAATLPRSTPVDPDAAAAPRPLIAAPEQSSSSIPLISVDEDTDGGRDTPTEMYAKGEQARDTPTRALEIRRQDPEAPPPSLDIRGSGSPSAPFAPSVANADGGYGQFASSSTMTAPMMGDAHFGLIQPTVRLPVPAEAPLPYGAPQGEAPGAGPALEAPGHAPHGAPSAPGHAPRGAPSGQSPGWQRSLDAALVRVGDGIERVAKGAVARFHAVSPRAQIAIAVGGASVLAATLVLLLYLMLR
ncbi:MAG: protein kinase [Polyangiaceae bacterium]|nr:protein kinase [Polyangiaceae bacterium]